MPGSKSASKPGAARAPFQWRRCTLEETGGFAGLHRGVTLVCTEVSADEAARISELLAALAQQAATAAQAESAQPDGQTLLIRAVGVKRTWEASYDTADLPKPAVELLRLAPPLRPLPRE